MFVDICIPKNNEKEFISLAEKIGTKGLLFLYDKKPKDLNTLQKETSVKILFDSKKNFAVGERKNVENKNIKFLYGFEELEEKDSVHYRRSGMNQVIGKLMKEKKKILVLDMEKIIFAKRNELMLGRVKQNLVLAKKYKLDLIICSFATKPENLRSGKDYESLIRVMGFQEEAKKAVSMLGNVLKE